MRGLAICTILVGIIIFCGFLLFLEFSHDSMQSIEWKQKTHVVQKGETLWDIAKKYCPNDVDIREWIYKIEEMNGIDGYIYPGDTLIVLDGKSIKEEE
jgi:nucleoid-associated protein YgaU